MRHQTIGPISHVQLLVALAAAGLFSAIALSVVGEAQSVNRVQIKTLSTDASRVTGGDVLVQVSLPETTRAQPRIAVDGRDVSSAFQPASAPHTLMGLVSGLADGNNTLTVSTRAGASDASLSITNFPITGPVFSGPPIEPFICQTAAFKLPDGTTLGTPLDEHCSAKTVVQYVYKSTAPPADQVQGR